MDSIPVWLLIVLRIAAENGVEDIRIAMDDGKLWHFGACDEDEPPARLHS